MFFQPFEAASSPSNKIVLILIALAWCIPSILTIPFQLESYQYIFANRAIIPDNVFFRNVVVKFDDAQMWLENLLTFKPKLQNVTMKMLYEIRNATSWNMLQEIATNLGMPEELKKTAVLG